MTREPVLRGSPTAQGFSRASLQSAATAPSGPTCFIINPCRAVLSSAGTLTNWTMRDDLGLSKWSLQNIWLCWVVPLAGRQQKPLNPRVLISCQENEGPETHPLLLSSAQKINDYLIHFDLVQRNAATEILGWNLVCMECKRNDHFFLNNIYIYAPWLQTCW